MRYLYILLVLIVFVGVFCLIWYLNSRTKKPDDCGELPEECKHCSVTICKNHPKDQKTEEKK